MAGRSFADGVRAEHHGGGAEGPSDAKRACDASCADVCPQSDTGRFRLVSLRALAAQFARFAGVGLVAFAVDYALMVFLVEVFGVDSVVAATVSYIVSIVVNYFMSMRFVFRRREGITRRREFTLFLVLALVGLAINDVLLWVATDLLLIDYRLAKLGVAVIVTMWNFWSRRELVGARG